MKDEKYTDPIIRTIERAEPNSSMHRFIKLAEFTRARRGPTVLGVFPGRAYSERVRAFKSIDHNDNYYYGGGAWRWLDTGARLSDDESKRLSELLETNGVRQLVHATMNADQ